MNQSNGFKSRRQFLKTIGAVSAGAALTLTGITTVKAEEVQTTPKKADLILSHPIKPNERMPIVASTSYLAVHAVKLRTLVKKSRFLIQCRFTSRNVKGAHFMLKLLDKHNNEIESISHTEEVGPEQTIYERKNALSFLSFWNRERYIRLNITATTIKKVNAFKIEVTNLNYT